MKDPKTVLCEGGVNLPTDLEVEVYENTPNAIHLVRPPRGKPAQESKS